MANDSSVPAREEKIMTPDGINLFIRSWQPQQKIRAVVAIVPGFNSHSGYYTWVAQQHCAEGLAVFAVDLRGRGRSDGERFYVEHMSDYAIDIEALVNLAKSRNPGLPVYLLGHSAGGVASCLYTLEHQGEIAGLICESFAFQVPAPDFALSILKGVSHLAPHAHVLKLHNEDFSRDPQVVKAMNEDPLIANESQPSLTVAEMVRADERLRQDFPSITLPLLILHGTADKATRPSGSQLFYDTAGSEDKTLKFYDGYYHDPLNDIGKEKVLNDIRSWMDARIGSASAASSAHAS